MSTIIPSQSALHHHVICFYNSLNSHSIIHELTHHQAQIPKFSCIILFSCIMNAESLVHLSSDITGLYCPSTLTRQCDNRMRPRFPWMLASRSSGLYFIARVISISNLLHEQNKTSHIVASASYPLYKGPHINSKTTTITFFILSFCNTKL